jgi:hypothetical protein
MMKDVVDIGVVISAALAITLGEVSPSRHLVELMRAGDRCELVTSELMLLELVAAARVTVARP